MFLMLIQFPYKYVQAWHLSGSGQEFGNHLSAPQLLEVTPLFLWVPVSPGVGKPSLGLW